MSDERWKYLACQTPEQLQWNWFNWSKLDRLKALDQLDVEQCEAVIQVYHPETWENANPRLVTGPIFWHEDPELVRSRALVRHATLSGTPLSVDDRRELLRNQPQSTDPELDNGEQ